MRAKRIQVTVTKEDIETGYPSSGESCPIALAICRRTDCVVCVGDGNPDDGPDGQIKIGDRHYRHTPASLRFVTRFDSGKKVRPTTFRFTEIRT